MLEICHDRKTEIDANGVYRKQETGSSQVINHNNRTNSESKNQVAKQEQN